SITVIDREQRVRIADIPTAAPKGLDAPLALRGSNPNALALSPDEKTLYVTNGGNNTLAVIDIRTEPARLRGLVPTGFYPHAVSVSSDGRTLYVAHGKSPSGPNPFGPWSNDRAL